MAKLNDTPDSLTSLFIIVVICVGGYFAWILMVKFHNAITYVMPNDEIILEVKKCEEAGLVADPVRSGISYEIVGIQCAPKN
jgi:hypothetical protein